MIKKHIQTRVYGHKTRGNCFQTAIASFLCMNPEDVPNVELFFNIPDYNWVDHFNVWLQDKGLIYRTGDEFKCYHISTPEEEADYNRNCSQTAAERRKILDHEYYFIAGKSPRNHAINHILIYRAGLLEHDTFPGEHEPLYLPPGTTPYKEFSFSVIDKI